MIAENRCPRNLEIFHKFDKAKPNRTVVVKFSVNNIPCKQNQIRLGCVDKLGDIIEATLNSIALQAKDVMDVMVDELGSKMVYLGVDGGASVNNYLMQYQANLLDVKLTRPLCLETTALGAAYLCGLALGVYENLDSIKKFHNIEKVFISNMDNKTRENINKSWKMAVNATMKYKK